LEVLLKCRILHIHQRSDRFYDVTVHTNEGLMHLLAKRIIDTTNQSSEKYFTVLFVCDDIEAVKDRLLLAYKKAQIESAFYPGRYALHVSAGDTDENRIKLEIYKKWCELDVNAKILYMAPVFAKRSSANTLCDDHYENPIEAFEAGYFYAKENGR